MKFLYGFLLTVLLTAPDVLQSQDPLSTARITGNFQVDGQYYLKDKDIGSQDVPEDFLSNSFIFVNYNLGGFSAGFRYEAYLNPMLGFDPLYKGSGFAYRFAEYKSDEIDITAGNFYEQFGSGLIFRAYEERQLGFDNSVDGARIKFRPSAGIEITGLIGKQRTFWNTGAGIVRGGDLNLSVNDLCKDLMPDDVQFKLGASVMSKYQADYESYYNLPENVMAWAARANLTGSSYNFEAEYAYKNPDPNATNKFSFNPGHGLILSGSYFEQGFGFNLNLHSIDNMGFRSDREVKGNILNMNFIPPLTKMQGYSLANIYPYATQMNGETGLQAEITYTFPKNSFLGGEYGMTVNANYSRVQTIDTTSKADLVYNSNWLNPLDVFDAGRRLLFQELSLELNKKMSADLKTKLTLILGLYNKDVLEKEGAEEFGMVNSFASIFEFTLKTAAKQALRMEFQHLYAEQDLELKQPDNSNGSWLTVLAEYTIAPHWYFTVLDEYNYGNDFEAKRLHYYNIATAYIVNSTRVSLSFGRQRGGLICVGGICRPVPAAYGMSFSITSSF